MQDKNTKKEKSIEELNKITDKIVDAFFAVHRNMGPGFNEAIYEASLIQEFRLHNLTVESQVEIPVFYKGIDLNKKYRLDLLVEDEIIVELKTVEHIMPIHTAQLLSYMKLAKKRIGYIANFNTLMMKDGIKRMRLDSGTIYHKDPLITMVRGAGPVQPVSYD